MTLLNPWRAKWIGRALMLFAVVLGLWLAAGVFWQLTTPAVRPLVPEFNATPSHQANALTARHLFGEATAGTLASVAAASDFVLRGVIADHRKQQGFAIIVVDGQAPVTVAEGKDIRPGVRLEKIYPNRIEISRQGVREAVLLTPANTANPPIPSTKN